MSRVEIDTTEGQVTLDWFAREEWGATGAHLGHVISEALFTKLNMNG